MQEYVDREMAEKLVESGMPQEAEKWWVKKLYENGYKELEKLELVSYEKKKEINESYYSYEKTPAYSLGQLLEALPDRYVIKNGWEVYKEWVVYSDNEARVVSDKSLLVALAKTILYIRSIGYEWDGMRLRKGVGDKCG